MQREGGGGAASKGCIDKTTQQLGAFPPPLLIWGIWGKKCGHVEDISLVVSAPLPHPSEVVMRGQGGGRGLLFCMYVCLSG